MLAAPVDPRAGLPPDGDAWAFEVKWDGMRVLADVHEGRLRLTSRLGNDVTAAWPELSGLAGLHPDVLLDGEVVVLRRGVPSFWALAERMHVRDARRAAALAAASPATFVAFDVLRLDGTELTKRSWTQRREALERLDGAAAGLRGWQLSPVYDDGQVLLAATLEQGLEGVVAKRRASRYAPGARNGDWLKLPHRRVQTCVVGGWRTETDDARRLGALLLGIWDLEPPGGGEPVLRFVGRVGSGLATADQGDVLALLAPHARETSPFGSSEVPRVDATGTRWLDPQVVVDVRHIGHSENGRIRQPVFLGVRTDVDPATVTAG
ncbi:non-homologous end-joining DNA ligase [Kineosporia sp. A_224]|uniref:non-homologous end-joining DNA ligase n=1 Tax=Kineosporia sp. A_224 TaxID=1962180 RepID=UPI001E5BCBA9|nr:non-homologous end-joining DNA ligase [Kineosporia sp. A_224]